MTFHPPAYNYLTPRMEEDGTGSGNRFVIKKRKTNATESDCLKAKVRGGRLRQSADLHCNVLRLLRFWDKRGAAHLEAHGRSARVPNLCVLTEIRLSQRGLFGACSIHVLALSFQEHAVWTGIERGLLRELWARPLGLRECTRSARHQISRCVVFVSSRMRVLLWSSCSR